MKIEIDGQEVEVGRLPPGSVLVIQPTGPISREKLVGMAQMAKTLREDMKAKGFQIYPLVIDHGYKVQLLEGKWTDVSERAF